MKLKCKIIRNLKLKVSSKSHSVLGVYNGVVHSVAQCLKGLASFAKIVMMLLLKNYVILQLSVMCNVV